MTKVLFLVEFTLPLGASVKDAKEYVEEAVQDYHGCYRPPGSEGEDDPGHPMFSLNEKTVKVREIR